MKKWPADSWGALAWLWMTTYVRRFAQGMGTLAKTDPIDARMIAWYASVKQPKPRPPSRPRRRYRLRRSSGSTGCHADDGEEPSRFSCDAYVQSSITAHIESIDEQIKQMEVEIDHLIDQEEEWQSRIACMTSCKGVGKVTAVTLLAEMPELGLTRNANKSLLWQG